MNHSVPSYLTEEERLRLSRPSLSIRSRFSVEGTLTGAHRSKRRGNAMEFADYRAYVPGDDLKRIDWRVYGKNERLYLKQSVEETMLRLHLVVDATASMNYKSPRGLLTKYDYAAKLATALALLTIRHQDQVSLNLLKPEDHEMRALPPGGGAQQLRLLETMLLQTTPKGTAPLPPLLHQLAETYHQRGIVVLLSDLLEEEEPLFQALSHLRQRGHQILLFHLMDPLETAPDELTGNFVDPETNEKLECDGNTIRDGYRRELDAFCSRWKERALQLRAHYELALTSEEPLDLLIRNLN